MWQLYYCNAEWFEQVAYLWDLICSRDIFVYVGKVKVEFFFRFFSINVLIILCDKFYSVFDWCLFNKSWVKLWEDKRLTFLGASDFFLKKFINDSIDTTSDMLQILLQAISSNILKKCFLGSTYLEQFWIYNRRQRVNKGRFIRFPKYST